MNRMVTWSGFSESYKYGQLFVLSMDRFYHGTHTFKLNSNTGRGINLWSDLESNQNKILGRDIVSINCEIWKFLLTPPPSLLPRPLSNQNCKFGQAWKIIKAVLPKFPLQNLVFNTKVLAKVCQWALAQLAPPPLISSRGRVRSWVQDAYVTYQ